MAVSTTGDHLTLWAVGVVGDRRARASSGEIGDDPTITTPIPAGR